jgi:hypothetical protein
MATAASIETKLFCCEATSSRKAAELRGVGRRRPVLFHQHLAVAHDQEAGGLLALHIVHDRLHRRGAVVRRRGQRRARDRRRQHRERRHDGSQDRLHDRDLPALCTTPGCPAADQRTRSADGIFRLVVRAFSDDLPVGGFRGEAGRLLPVMQAVAMAGSPSG